MNKVLCIDLPNSIQQGINAKPIIEVGCVYHINCDCYGDGMFYELVEHIGYAYASRCFAPCSDIDETELIRERQKQLA